MMAKPLRLGTWLGVLAVLWGGAAWAEQRNSFTYTSTAGMFEDTYDYFEFSPAYLPSFQKNVFWGQLSNLGSGGEQQINNLTNNNTTFLIGGQADVLGYGRAGAMFDWAGATTAQPAQNFNGYAAPGGGLAEDTRADYKDTDGDGIIDYRSESYSRVKREQNTSSNDLYLAYGLGGLFGLDLGAALRGVWQNSSPTYAPSALGYGNVGYSFDEVTRQRKVDLAGGNTIYAFDRTGTGSLDYGSSAWRLLLGARAKDWLPNLDLAANLGPVLVSGYNRLTAQLTDYTDFTPGAAVDSNLANTSRLKGMDLSAPIYPGTGLGVQADARGDYALMPGVILTGLVGFTSGPTTLSGDAQYESTQSSRQQQTLGSNLVVTDSNYLLREAFSGTTTDYALTTKLRAQFVAKNLKVGLGVNYAHADWAQDIQNRITTNNVTRVSGTGDPAQDYLRTYGGTNDIQLKTETATSQLEFPLGVVLEVIDNLPIRFGAKHSVTYASDSASYEITDRTPIVTHTVYADGSVTDSVMGYSNGQPEYSNCSYTITHATTYYYGASWWPLSYLQIDFTGFAGNLLTLTGYNLSFNFYF
jgi:hypothetical protein